MKQNLSTVLPLLLRTPKKEEALVSNQEAYAFWIGHILGDAYISKSNGYMQVDQASEPLAKWLHNKLGTFGMLPPTSKIQRTERFDKRYQKTNVSFRFCTRAYLIEDWINTFYKYKKDKKVKCIPTNISTLLIEPFSLAIWFLGDGWFDGDNVCFAAGIWDKEECEILQNCLKVNFGLETSLVLLDPLKNNGCEVHRLTVRAASYATFYSLVKPFLLEFENFAGSEMSSSFLKRKVLPKPTSI